MDQTIKTLKQPFTAVRQVWEDYQVGRAIRQRALKGDTEEDKCGEECGEKCPETCNEEDNDECKEEHDEKPNEEREEECKDETLNERGECSDLNEEQCNDDKVSSQPTEYSTGKQEQVNQYSRPDKRKWKHNMGVEFPWRYEQLVDGESNWRGTWVLEVKDLRAMKWGTEIVPTMIGNRKGRKIVRKPTRQLPFPIGQEKSLLPSEGGQDNSLLPLEGGQESGLLLSEGDQDDLMVWLGKS